VSTALFYNFLIKVNRKILRIIIGRSEKKLLEI